ncbi:tail assembly protein [Paracoccus lutimaris]|uniref:Putative phage tail protein n=1 Tax=Paracoccus lutimaris TaxID=1490030 RepID=A0A368YEA5_9RHOB|nr:tail assembly protein [Paracoccus lutimaris]RCW78542.1 putative phage tail protein [Paracoccus lutimaris]
MRNVHLHGALGKKFGKLHQFNTDTVADVIEALRANFNEFFNAIRNGHYRVVVGDTARSGMALSEDMLPGFKLGKQPLHIVPVMKGSKRGGLGKIIAGIALIGLSMVTGGAFGAAMGTTLWGGATVGSVAGSLGAGLLINGVASFIAPEADGSETEQSFTMTGPQVTTREGGIIPIVYGEVWTGGTMINGSLSIERGNA